MTKNILRVLLTLSIAGSITFAQTGVSKRGTTSAPFLSIAQGARALSMGGAFVAVASDPSAMFWNPAGVAELQGFNLIFDHTLWIADIKYEYLGITYNVGSFGALGLNITASNIGDMKVTTVDMQDGTGEVFGVSDIAVGLTYAIKLTEDFSIGFNPKFIHQSIWKMSANAFAIDLGVKYRTPFRGFTLGMSASNFGGKMRMQGDNALVLYDPDPDNGGNNSRIPAELQTDEWALPLNFRIGLAYDVTFGSFGALTLAVDGQHPADDYESVNVGGEYVFDNVLYLRGGWKSLWLKNSEEGLTLGIGVQEYVTGTLRFSVDYAYQNFSRLKNAQKISIGISF
jgi:hypothetical protein